MRVMIIGAFKGQVGTAAKIAINKGASVVHAETLEQALATLRLGQGADILFVDLHLNIKKVLKDLTQERFKIPVIACGINATPAEAAAAIAAGAQDYMPFPPDADLIAAILEAVSRQDKSLIFKDPKMQRCVLIADRIAPSEASVLITGESGTGKEVMARYIHDHSKRSRKPFISINCAAIPENLLESELFGHEKGAFTGAVARRLGKFEEANGGTLLLDEITEMHPRLQAKLLRAIQERVIDRVGGNQPVKVDIRIIATSNRDLLQACKSGDFREDLYYRLNVVNLQLPPLRERPKDIEVLTKYFMEKYAKINFMAVKEFSDGALKAIASYPWEGNVRQLENLIHRSLLLASGDKIEAEDLFENAASAVTSMAVASDVERQLLIGRTVAAVEKDLIIGTLDHCSGNRTHAANILGISIRTLRNKLKEYADSPLSQTMG